MAKKTRWLPNLRVDLDDLEQGTHGYQDEKQREVAQSFLKDTYPRIAEGFRVEIVDAATREIAVYSGVALDQNGQLVNNAESMATSRSLTLGGNATYYIEVEFSEVESDTDVRAFWDPAYDNGLDTSGDVLPDGREASQSVATRKTLDWSVVSPPSTSGFEVSSTPGSTKIPVAVIVVAAGVIDASVTTSTAATCFAESYALGETQIRLLNTRHFPDSFDIRLGPGTANQEDLTVDANDRENGILTLNAATANAHSIGERAINVDAAAQDFVDERVLMDEVGTGGAGAGPIAGDAGDARIRMFQGDTERGYALSQNPDLNVGYSDIQLRSLKDQVDYLASQMLEMKYGSGSSELMGQDGPLLSFAVREHYYRSGGILPARGHTVSVGDGVNTWGDYNVTTSGSAEAAIVAAVAAIPANGGTVYIKAGTYVLTSSNIVISKNVTFVGDGRDATVIECSGTGGFDLDTAGIKVVMRDLSITDTGGTATAAIQATDTVSLVADNCEIAAISSGTLEDSILTSCTITHNTVMNAAVQGTVNESIFRDCVVSVPEDGKAFDLTAGSKVTLDGCTFTQATTTGGTSGYGVAVTNMTKVVIKDCSFFDCDYGIQLGVSLTDVRIDGNVITQTNTGGSKCRHGITTVSGGHEAEDLLITNNRISYLKDDTDSEICGIYLEYDSSTIDPENMVVRSNHIHNLGDEADATDAYGVYIHTPDFGEQEQIFIDSNVITDIFSSSSSKGVYIDHAQYANITSNRIWGIGTTSIASTADLYGIDVNECEDVTISDNSVRCGDTDNTKADNAAIRLGSSTAGNQYRAVVNGNRIRFWADGSTDVAGIMFDGAAVDVTCVGNQVDGFSQEAIGIYINSQSSAPRLGEMAVSSNSISGASVNDLKTGIFVEIAAGTQSGEGKISIVGNVIASYEDKGISVLGSSTVERTTSVAITGNTLITSDSDVVYGIEVQDMTGITIGSNVVFHSSSITSSSSLIYLRDVREFAVSGNSLKADGTGTMYGVNTNSTCTFGTVNGNIIRTFANTAGEGINSSGTPGSVLFVGNQVEMAAGTVLGSGSGQTTDGAGDALNFT